MLPSEAFHTANLLNLSRPETVVCTFREHAEPAAWTGFEPPSVYFSIKAYYEALVPALAGYLSAEERMRAEKFLARPNKDTYIACHAVLRLLLSAHTHIPAASLVFARNPYDKPYLEGSNTNFNITHTSDAFAIVIASDLPVGIDLDRIAPGKDFQSVARNYFSPSESRYVLDAEYEIPERFFKLWTRKEALLKAIGTGLIDRLGEVEVDRGINPLQPEIFEGLQPDEVHPFYQVYSGIIEQYYLSVALPISTEIRFLRLDGSGLKSFLP